MPRRRKTLTITGTGTNFPLRYKFARAVGVITLKKKLDDTE